jgi:hypothetical protein
VQVIVEVETKLAPTSAINISASLMLPRCAPTAALRKVWRATVITGVGSRRLFGASLTNGGTAFFCRCCAVSMARFLSKNVNV